MQETQLPLFVGFRMIPGEYTLKRIKEKRGLLTVLDNLPGWVKRFYIFCDVGPEESRGHHAHHRLRQLLIVVKGRVRIKLETPSACDELVIDENSDGLWIEPMVWHVLDSFARDTIVLVLCDNYYCESDYIRDWAMFQKKAGGT